MKQAVRIIAALSISAMLLVANVLALSVTYNADPIEFDVPPQNINGRLLVPMRAIFEALGASVEWDPSTQTATGTLDERIVSVTIGKTTAYANGRPVTLDVPAQVIESRTLVPLRFIAESLDTNVQWDATTGTARICDQLYTVIRVVDGDTILVDYNGLEERVRLIGIDTPESVHPDETKNVEAGKTASEYTSKLLAGKQVELEFDVQERDMYQRLLAYVYVDGVMLNKTLLREDHANLSTWPPNVKYVDEFRQIAAERHDGAVKTSGLYLGSVKSDKYHNPTCRHAETIADYNQIWFDTKEEAQQAGYSPCKVCKP